MANLTRRLEQLERIAPHPACPNCDGSPPFVVLDWRDGATPERPTPCVRCGRSPIVLSLQWAENWREDTPLPEERPMPEAPPAPEAVPMPVTVLEAPPLPQEPPPPVATPVAPPLTAAQQADRQRAQDLAALLAAARAPLPELPDERAPRFKWTLE
jgi:hypothetical protein